MNNLNLQQKELNGRLERRAQLLIDNLKEKSPSVVVKFSLNNFIESVVDIMKEKGYSKDDIKHALDDMNKAAVNCLDR